MKPLKVVTGAMTAWAAAFGGAPALAGGLDRSAQSTAILFETGTYAEFILGGANPDVSGTVGGGAISSGDMAPGFGIFALGYKQALRDNLDLAIILDRPVGANVSYPAAAAPYPFAGATADVDSYALTGLLRYRMPSSMSVFGGLRAQSVKGTVAIPLFGYTMSTDTDYKVGYVLGAAWEKPEIAARVSLTYNSRITHSFTANENISATPTTFETEIPQSVNLEFQTGVAPGTLVFGSVRWQEWSKFDITPPTFDGAIGGSLSNITTNSVTYNLGVGRKFSDTWSGAILLAYEPSAGVQVGNLGPTDGYRGIGLAATYSRGQMKITGGLRYYEIGSATTAAIGGRFTGNSGVAAGLKLALNF